MKAKKLRDKVQEPWTRDQVVLQRRAWCLVTFTDRAERPSEWNTWKIPYRELSRGYSGVSPLFFIKLSCLHTFPFRLGGTQLHRGP